MQRQERSTVEQSSQINLSERQFERITAEIYRLCGINLSATKKLLVEGRIRKRMKQLSFESFDAYLDYFFSREGYEAEYVNLIDVITTNKSDFFRENHHFDFLKETGLPAIIRYMETNLKSRSMSFWSAGCSSGEEPYTLAIVLKEYFENRKNIQFTIYASDVSTLILDSAIAGIYEAEKIDSIPLTLKKKYFLKSKAVDKNLIRVASEIRDLVDFRRINFLESDYDIPGNLDAAFCRNVLIYFDRQTQESVLKKILRKIRGEGYLFLGHSETITGLDLPLRRIAPTIYQKI